MGWSAYLKPAFTNKVTFATTNSELVINYVNDKFCDSLGYDRKFILGSSLPLGLPRPQQQEFFKAVHEAIEIFGRWKGIIAHRSSNGETVEIDTVLKPLLDEGGQVVGYFVVEASMEATSYEQAELESKVEVLRAIFDAFPGGIIHVTPDSVLRAANLKFYELLELDQDLIPVGSRYDNLIEYLARKSGAKDAWIEGSIAKHLADIETQHDYKGVWIREDGVTLDIMASPVDSGGFVVTFADVTRRNEEKATRELYSRIIDHSASEIYLINIKKGIMFSAANAAACSNSGYAIEEFDDLPIDRIFIDYSRDKFDALIHHLEQENNSHIRLQTTFQRKDGTDYEVEAIFQLMRYGKNSVVSVIANDITQRREQERRVEYLAMHDELTGLPNRVHFSKKLEQLLDAASPEKEFALFYLDLDKFKYVNDTFGHDMGDALLKVVAERIRTCVRKSDMIARIGGDEFAALIDPIDSIERVKTLARDIRNAVAAPYEIKGRKLDIDTSIGIAIAPQDGDNPDALKKNADLALYKSKNTAASIQCLYSSNLRIEQESQTVLGNELEAGLDRGELLLHYQPIVNLHNGEITTVEAFVRWLHPEKGLLKPQEFLPLAAQRRLMDKIGMLVLNMAVNEIRQLPDHIKVAVNLSLSQLEDTSLPLKIATELAQAGLNPARLELEILEVSILDELVHLREMMMQLRTLGVNISIDNFGDGNASLHNLKNCGIDKIKIGREFIHGVVKNQKTKGILDGITTAGNRIGITTTAKCIETEEQLRIVRWAKFDEMQGDYFSRPRSMAEIAATYFPGKITTSNG